MKDHDRRIPRFTLQPLLLLGLLAQAAGFAAGLPAEQFALESITLKQAHFSPWAKLELAFTGCGVATVSPGGFKHDVDIKMNGAAWIKLRANNDTKFTLCMPSAAVDAPTTNIIGTLSETGEQVLNQTTTIFKRSGFYSLGFVNQTQPGMSILQSLPMMRLNITTPYADPADQQSQWISSTGQVSGRVMTAYAPALPAGAPRVRPGTTVRVITLADFTFLPTEVVSGPEPEFQIGPFYTSASPVTVYPLTNITLTGEFTTNGEYRCGFLTSGGDRLVSDTASPAADGASVVCQLPKSIVDYNLKPGEYNILLEEVSEKLNGEFQGISRASQAPPTFIYGGSSPPLPPAGIVSNADYDGLKTPKRLENV
eukprot:TRINITY_DN1426_c0_g1_i7.p1 TRINITY_DN1426_c0_g1~~TRINITY_DN1426_c0_g1_i7.p1  ORF type:complete len:377 (+),score=72.98 TRINITY_DN1426_c0_g1_i7:30-1133(+)